MVEVFKQVDLGHDVGEGGRRKGEEGDGLDSDRFASEKVECAVDVSRGTPAQEVP